MNRITVLLIDRDSSKTTSANFEIDAQLNNNVQEFIQETNYRKYFIEADIDDEWEELTPEEQQFIIDAELETDLV